MNNCNTGVMIYAHDNAVVDYGSLAFCAASLVRKHLGVPVCLVTDDPTRDKMISKWGKSAITNLFEYSVIYEDKPCGSVRKYKDRDEILNGEFLNGNRNTALDYTPFDQTLVIDADYLIQSDILKQVWLQNKHINHRTSEMRLNKKIASINDPMNVQIKYLSDTSIPMYWATVFWFRKTQNTKRFFELVEYVKSNIEYFKRLYKFSSGIYRNDFTFSVAAHLMSSNTNFSWMTDLPENSLLFAWPDAELVDVRSEQLIFRVNDKTQKGKIPVILENQSVHCLNKSALLRNLDKILDTI